MTNPQLWQRYKQYLCECPKIGLTLDISRMNFGDDFITGMMPAMKAAFAAMEKLEAGAIANPDENRMVGHYWLRRPELAPNPELRQAIAQTRAQVKAFAREVRHGIIRTVKDRNFTDLLVIGIGGSALGPQLVADALGVARRRLTPHFFDNTDPDGMERILVQMGQHLSRTLTVVISKSGGTQETRNGLRVAQAAYRAAGIEFAPQAVAVTGVGSELDRQAASEKWLRRFPMWDWVGGRQSELSAVGLLPAALQGINIEPMLKGARDTDALTRRPDIRKNPAALLALMWYYAGAGRGERAMVVLPYKDRLQLLSRYLQQLVMESLGKQFNRAGQVVHQGLCVYGNKGSTDQHAYVQQLREGPNNFFVTFIEVLADTALGQAPSPAARLEVEPGATSGDYLNGFLHGTREALYENGRESLTITVEEVSPRSMGVLLALFERAVGLYAELININAYHQPGVEAGKKAAQAVLAWQGKIMEHLKAGGSGTAEQIAAAMGAPEATETIFCILRRLAANPGRGVKAELAPSLTDTRFASS